MDKQEREQRKAKARQWVQDLKQHQTDPVDLEKEQRAFELLQWVVFGLPVDFDEVLAAEGHYSRLQRERSNKALDAWDEQHKREPNAELAAFYELEKRGIYSHNDFYSPGKAKDGFYTRRLERASEGRASDRRSRLGDRSSRGSRTTQPSQKIRPQKRFKRASRKADPC